MESSLTMSLGRAPGLRKDAEHGSDGAAHIKSIFLFVRLR
jgi:hypothetical protein